MVKRFGTAMMPAVLLMASCLSPVDETWEGTYDRCTGSTSNASQRVILLLDAPVLGPTTGYFGLAANGAADDWLMTSLKDAQSLPSGLKFKAVFDSGTRTTRFDADLKRTGSEYSGDLEITDSSVHKCDMKLTRK